MEHTPPPFFNRGPAPLVRLAFFASLSLALLVLDARFHYAEGLRSVLALAVYPLQTLAGMPAALGERISGFFLSQAQLRDENDLRRHQFSESVLSRAKRDAHRAAVRRDESQ